MNRFLYMGMSTLFMTYFYSIIKYSSQTLATKAFMHPVTIMTRSPVGILTRAGNMPDMERLGSFICLIESI